MHLCKAAPVPHLTPINLYEINDENQANEITVTTNQNAPTELHFGQDSNNQIIIFTDSNDYFDGWGG